MAVVQLTLPTVGNSGSLSGTSNIVIGVTMEMQNKRLNEMALTKITQSVTTATINAISQRISSVGAGIASSRIQGSSYDERVDEDTAGTEYGVQLRGDLQF